jgi:methyl-accepting chemotaxis protein-1 (serine sensor receptor)
MKLGVKLPLAFGIVLLLMLMGGLFGVFKLGSSIKQYDMDVGALVEAERKASEAESRFSAAVQAWKNILLRGKDAAKLEQHEGSSRPTCKRSPSWGNNSKLH